MSINSDYSADCPECDARVRVAANYCATCGYHLAGDRDGSDEQPDSDDTPDHADPLLERGKQELVDGLDSATGFMYAQIQQNGRITVRYSLDMQRYDDPGHIFNALIYAIENPEDGVLDLDDLEQVLKDQESAPEGSAHD